MTQRLEKNSGTFLPIALSCLFFLFMAASALTSVPSADAVTPTQEIAAQEVTTQETTPLVDDMTEPALHQTEEVADDVALPVAMLMNPTPSRHQVSYTENSMRGLELA